MAKLKVEGHENLVRDTTSNAVINSSSSEYRIYMSRYKLREIKDLIKKVIEK